MYVLSVCYYDCGIVNLLVTGYLVVCVVGFSVRRCMRVCCWIGLYLEFGWMFGYEVDCGCLMSIYLCLGLFNCACFVAYF